jgi:hypothetical protein
VTRPLHTAAAIRRRGYWPGVVYGLTPPDPLDATGLLCLATIGAGIHRAINKAPTVVGHKVQQ